MTKTNTKIQHEFIPDCVNLTKFFWCQRRALRRASGLPPFASIHQVWAPPEEAREWVCHCGEVLPGACQDQQSVTVDYVIYSTFSNTGTKFIYTRAVKHKARGQETARQKLQSSPLDGIGKCEAGNKCLTFYCIFISLQLSPPQVFILHPSNVGWL